MSAENENNFKSVSVEEKYDKTDNSLNNSDNNNQNENSIDPSQEVKASTDDKVSSSNVVYTKSCTMNKKKKINHRFHCWRNYFNWSYYSYNYLN